MSHGRPPTRSSFDNEERHVTAFRPISEGLAIGHATRLNDSFAAVVWGYIRYPSTMTVVVQHFVWSIMSFILIDSCSVI